MKDAVSAAQRGTKARIRLHHAGHRLVTEAGASLQASPRLEGADAPLPRLDVARDIRAGNANGADVLEGTSVQGNGPAGIRIPV